MNPDISAQQKTADTRFAELFELLESTREALAKQTLLANERLDEINRLQAECTRVNGVLHETRSAWTNMVQNSSAAFRALERVREVTDAVVTFRNAGVSLGPDAYRAILVAIGDHASCGLGDDKQG